MTESPSSRPRGNPSDGFGWSLLVLCVLALSLGWWNRSVINTDAIAYLQMADHYLSGRTDLALNGYWGPLLSWIMIPPLLIGTDPLVAARIAMFGSALVFLFGARSFMNSFSVSGNGLRLGLLLCAFTGAVWSSQNITPDLLLAGLALFALAVTNRAIRTGRLGLAGVAGVVWGVAYHAKAIALPWAILVLGVHFLVDWWTGNLRHRVMVVTFSVMMLMVSPWIWAISAQAGHPTISTSSVAAHALAGPPGVDRYHPSLSTLHVPREGRVTAWENPVELDYATWSPFASGEYFIHQLKRVGGNVFRILFVITSLFPVWPLVVWVWTRGDSLKDLLPVVRAAAPLDLLCLLYLPFYLTANEQRYFYIAVPLLWVALTVPRPFDTSTSKSPWPGVSGLRIGFALVVAALFVSTFAYQFPARTAGMEARELADWLESREPGGSVAGSAMRPGGRAGLYTAWFLGVPWYGDQPRDDGNGLLSSGADLLVLGADDTRLERLQDASAFRRLPLPVSLSGTFAVFRRN